MNLTERINSRGFINLSHDNQNSLLGRRSHLKDQEPFTSIDIRWSEKKVRSESITVRSLNLRPLGRDLTHMSARQDTANGLNNTNYSELRRFSMDCTIQQIVLLSRQLLDPPGTPKVWGAITHYIWRNSYFSQKTDILRLAWMTYICNGRFTAAPVWVLGRLTRRFSLSPNRNCSTKPLK